MFVCVCVYVGGWVAGRVGVCTYVYACSLAYPACNAYAPYCHLRPLWLYHIFRHYLINGTIFWKKLLKIKCVFWFSIQLLSQTFLILRRIQRDIVQNVGTSSCKVPVILVGFQRNFNFLDRFSKKAEVLNSVKIRPVEAELLHVSGLTVAFRLNRFTALAVPEYSTARVWLCAFKQRPKFASQAFALRVASFCKPRLLSVDWWDECWVACVKRWKETVLVWSEVVTVTTSGCTEENPANLSQQGQSSSLELNPGHAGYEAGMTHSWLWPWFQYRWSKRIDTCNNR